MFYNMSSLNIFSYDGPFFEIAPPPHWKIVKRGPGPNSSYLIEMSGAV